MMGFISNLYEVDLQRFFLWVNFFVEICSDCCKKLFVYSFYEARYCMYVSEIFVF